jgi:hypothetical protein
MSGSCSYPIRKQVNHASRLIEKGASTICVTRFSRESGGKPYQQAVRDTFPLKCLCGEVDLLVHSRVFGHSAITLASTMADMNIVGFLAFVGCLLILWFLAESLWNLFNGVKAHLLPNYKPTSVDLTKKFGSWAG